MWRESFETNNGAQEQISQSFKKSAELPQVSHETIYRHIYLDEGNPADRWSSYAEAVVEGKKVRALRVSEADLMADLKRRRGPLQIVMA